MQSIQDDNYEALELLAEQIFIFLTLKAIQTRLSTDETWILERAAKVAALIQAPAEDVAGRLHRGCVSG
jgi:hypothetical protein